MRRTSSLIIPAVILGLATGLAGCARDGLSNAALAPADGQTRPMPRPGADALPGANAVTVDEFDTTTPEERAAAASDNSAGTRVGRTVAALGNPADPGFWLETPLVDTAGEGRVVSVANGKHVALALRPIDGEPGAGSRISLPALRLLEVGLAGLHEVDVYAD